MLKKIIIVLSFSYLVFSSTSSYSQHRNEIQFFKLYLEDDYLNFRGEGTDRGYTGGIKLEVYYTKKNKPRFPSTMLMRISDSSDNVYGWGINQFVYTPNDIAKTAIQYGDRPYAGVTYLSHSLISSNSEKKAKLTTTFSLGAIGRFSYASESQNWLHNIVHYQNAKGWENQIASDLIINYFIDYEKQLFKPNNHMDIIGNLQANAGTLSNNMGLGIKFRAGIFNNYFCNYQRPTFRDGPQRPPNMKKFQCYFFMKTTGVAVLDDATLEGGFITHESSPYKIDKDSISRAYMQYEYGLVLARKRLGISISEKIRTPDFKGTFAQQVGNFTLFVGL